MQKSRWIIWGILSCIVFLLLFMLYMGTPPILRTAQLFVTVFGASLIIAIFLLGFIWLEDKQNRKAYIIKEGYMLQETLENGHTIWIKTTNNLVWVCEMDSKDYVVSNKRYQQKEIEILYAIQNKIL